MNNKSNIVLDINSEQVKYLTGKDKRLLFLIEKIGVLSYNKVYNYYDFIIHEIIEQMLSIKAGNKIYTRLKMICNGNICPEKLSNLTNEEIKSIGTSSLKVTYIKSITDFFISGNFSNIEFNKMNDDEIIKTLTKIRGIGNWTAKMFLIFALDRQDVLPHEDAAFMQSYKWLYNVKNPSKQSVISKCSKWRPYSSIAARYLYRALDTGLTKQPITI